LIDLLLLAWLLFSPHHAMPATPSIAAAPMIAAHATADTLPSSQPIVAAAHAQPCDGNRIDCPPSLSFAEFRRVLVAHHTRMSSSNVSFAYQDGISWGIDPGWFLAIICKESDCGGDSSPVTYPCHNIGDFATGDATPCAGNPRYRWYPSWHAAIDDWYSHVRRYYIDEGIVYIGDVVPRYYGSVNEEYLDEVTSWLAQWRAEDKGGK
jgi:hypothetical protein